MRIDWEQMWVEMGVGEWASFDLPLGADRFPGMASAAMEEGQRWHLELAQQAGKRWPGSVFERPLRGVLPVGRWNVHLQGRIDQLLWQGRGWLLREVKAVGRGLPCDPSHLREAYPAYFCQLAAYFVLLADGGIALEPGTPEAFGAEGAVPAVVDQASSGGSVALSGAELVFVSRENGLLQVIPLDLAEARQLVTASCRRLEQFLEIRRRARMRRLEASPSAPFEQLRPGQAEVRQALRQPPLARRVTFFQASTGFGKTGILLEYALERLCRGHCERILYLTGKSTGQLPVTAQVQRMCPPESGIRLM
jgi:DNA excision repair protein ERCC-2